eukprot:scaffold16300_cov150-Cylindrotheca_fusiformis.AAC.4
MNQTSDTMSSDGTYHNASTVATGGGSQSSNQESFSGRGMTPYVWLFSTWAILLLLMASLTVLVILRNRRRHSSSTPSSQDVDDAQGLSAVSATMDQQHANETATTPSATERYIEIGFFSILVIAAIVGLGLAICSILSCDFVQLENSITLQKKEANGDVTSIEFYSLGLWAVALSSDSGLFLYFAEDDVGGGERRDLCLETSGFLPMEWQYKLARASAIIASLLGGFSILVLLVVAATTKKEGEEEMASNKRSMTRFWTGSFALAGFFQLLTLVLFRTLYCDWMDEESNCHLSMGAVNSISAAIYWLFCAVAVSVSFATSSDK